MTASTAPFRNPSSVEVIFNRTWGFLVGAGRRRDRPPSGVGA
ncbi:MAG: hypothetical protein Q8R92_16100 [Deltaproteobacteria bacterium]|nr:hypothetical protein [Deltaproteobacteria bacterium]